MNFIDPPTPDAAFTLSGLASGLFIPSFNLLQLFPYGLLKYPRAGKLANLFRS